MRGYYEVTLKILVGVEADNAEQAEDDAIELLGDEWYSADVIETTLVESYEDDGEGEE